MLPVAARICRELGKEEIRIGPLSGFGHFAKKTRIFRPGLCFLLCFRLEIVLADATDRAAPVVRQLLKRGAGDYAVVGIALCRIVNVTANFANVLFHDSCCFSGDVVFFNSGQKY